MFAKLYEQQHCENWSNSCLPLGW